MTHLLQGDKYKPSEAPELLLQRFMRHERVAQCALLVLFVTWFGFVAADRTGWGQHEGIWANHVLRIAGWVVATGMVAVSALRHRVYVRPFGVLKTLMMFHCVFLALLLAASFRGLEISPTAYFRVAEWVSLSFVLSQAFGREDGRRDRLVGFSKVLVYLLAAIIGFYLLAFPNAVVTASESRLQLGGTAIHPNRLAFVGACGVVLFGLFLRRKSDIFGFLLSLGLAFAAGSRVGYLLVGLALLVVVVSYLSAGKRAVVLFYAALALAGAAIVMLENGGVAWLLADGDHGTLNGRLAVWQAALQLIGEAPILGWGLIDGPRLIGTLVHEPWWNPTNAQNEVLSAGVSGGLIGLVALLMLYVVLTRGLVRMPKGAARLYASTAFALYIISSQFEPLFVHHATQAALVLVLALILVEPHEDRPAAIQRTGEADGGKQGP